jgi:RNA polymerase sigma factor (sigma-70 family)
MVWGVCQRLVAHRQDAEDCFQATFLVLCRKAGSIGRSKLLANWLFGVARRAALNARARRARRARHEVLCAQLPEVPAAAPIPWDDALSVLDEELARLPSKYRVPLLLCGLEGMTHAQAGKSLGWPVGTVAGRLSRGREMLRMRLLRRGVLAPGAALSAWLGADAAPADVPPQLAAASVRSAVALCMAGQSAPADIPATVALLAGSVLRRMLVHRLLTKSVLIAVLVLVLGGAVGAWQLKRSVETPPPAPTGPVLTAELLGSARRSAPAELPGRPTVRLPADPSAVVLRMDRSVDSSAVPGTKVMVFADGRVVAEVPDGLVSLSAQELTQYVRGRPQGANERQAPKIKVLEGKLTALELDELMRFVVQDQDFLAFDPAAVKAAIWEEYKSDGSVPDANDATTTEFFAQTAQSKHQVSWSRLDRSLWNFPKVQSLRRLRGLELRLAHVYYVLLAGGPERVAEVVGRMERLLVFYYLNHPNAPRLTAADLCNVVPAADESAIRYEFSRQKDTFDFKPLFAATIVVPRQGEPFLYSLIPPQ